MIIPPINPQGNPSPLTYPVLPLIQQKTVLHQWNQICPRKTRRPFSIKRILKITWDQGHHHHHHQDPESVENIIRTIRKIVIGDNYQRYKDLIVQRRFEYSNSIGMNYLSLLNLDIFIIYMISLVPRYVI